MAERSKYLTVMLVPDASGAEVRRLRVAKLWLGLGLAGVAVALVAAVLGVGLAAGARQKVSEGRALRAENERMRQALVALEGDVAKARAALARLGQVEKKVRAMTHVSDPTRSLAMGPMGGRGESATAPREIESALFARDPVTAAASVGVHADAVSKDAERAADRVAALSELLKAEAKRMASTPSWRPSRGYMSSSFGMRVDPFTGLPQRHAGLDFVAPIGSEVRATADGRVRTAGPRGAYGLLVEIDHGHGLTTRYAHLSEVRVKPGQIVERGLPVGAVGNTGRSTGPHLHYEVRLHGVPRDPRAFILE